MTEQFWIRVECEPERVPGDTGEEEEESPRAGVKQTQRETIVSLDASAHRRVSVVKSGSLRFYVPRLHALHGVEIEVRRRAPRVPARESPRASVLYVDCVHVIPQSILSLDDMLLTMAEMPALSPFACPVIEAGALGWRYGDVPEMCRAAAAWHACGSPWQLRAIGAGDVYERCTRSIVAIEQRPDSWRVLDVLLESPFPSHVCWVAQELFVPDPESPAAASALLCGPVWRDTAHGNAELAAAMYAAFPEATVASRVEFPACAGPVSRAELPKALRRALEPHGILSGVDATGHLQLSLECDAGDVAVALNDVARSALGACTSVIALRAGIIWRSPARVEACAARGRWFHGSVVLHAVEGGTPAVFPFEAALPRAGGDVEIPLRVPAPRRVCGGIERVIVQMAPDATPACVAETSMSVVLGCADTWEEPALVGNAPTVCGCAHS